MTIENKKENQRNQSEDLTDKHRLTINNWLTNLLCWFTLIENVHALAQNESSVGILKEKKKESCRVDRM